MSSVKDYKECVYKILAASISPKMGQTVGVVGLSKDEEGFQKRISYVKGRFPDVNVERYTNDVFYSESNKFKIDGKVFEKLDSVIFYANDPEVHSYDYEILSYCLMRHLKNNSHISILIDPLSAYQYMTSLNSMSKNIMMVPISRQISEGVIDIIITFKKTKSFNKPKTVFRVNKGVCIYSDYENRVLTAQAHRILEEGKPLEL